MTSLQWLQKLEIPVRIFHATVDPVTPIEGARNLEKVRLGDLA